MPTLSTETVNTLFTIDVIAEIFLAIIVPAAVFVWCKFDSALWNHRAENKNKKIRDEIVNNDPSCVPVLVEMTDRNFSEFPTGPRTKK